MSKQRFVTTYGLIAGVLLVIVFYGSMLAGAHHGPWGIWIGYLAMLIPMSMVFVGVKRYRDEQLGGVIRFGTALVLGLGIALIASLFYVFGWEIYLYATGYSFAADYMAGYVENMRASGASAVEISSTEAEAAEFVRQYADPLYRLPMTFMEILPVVVVVPLVSAGLLRNSRFMPARPA